MHANLHAYVSVNINFIQTLHISIKFENLAIGFSKLASCDDQIHCIRKLSA